ncbi:MAG: hypothetical protein HYY37_00125 [Candidatus Aenigmarchaeota archaeon]|nr:hypothetical protein [Candidatus Aenigmarchaeota archaeon]
MTAFEWKVKNSHVDVVKKFAETAAAAKHEGRIDFDVEYERQLDIRW